MDAQTLTFENRETQQRNGEVPEGIDESVVRGGPRPNKRRRVFVAASLLAIVVLTGVWIARQEPEEPPVAASTESSRTSPTPSPAESVGALKAVDHGVTASNGVAPNDSSPGVENDESGSSPAAAVTKALELFDHGDYQDCIDVLAALPPEPEVNTLRRRCETANRQAPTASKHPATAQEHTIGARQVSTRRRPPGGKVASPTQTRDRPPRAEGEGPFARDAPW